VPPNGGIDAVSFRYADNKKKEKRHKAKDGRAPKPERFQSFEGQSAVASELIVKLADTRRERSTWFPREISAAAPEWVQKAGAHSQAEVQLRGESSRLGARARS
jgi:hypothetical protein